MCMYRTLRSISLNLVVLSLLLWLEFRFRFQATEYDGRFFLNPGTATGAWTGAFPEYVSAIP